MKIRFRSLSWLAATALLVILTVAQLPELATRLPVSRALGQETAPGVAQADNSDQTSKEAAADAPATGTAAPQDEGKPGKADDQSKRRLTSQSGAVKKNGTAGGSSAGQVGGMPPGAGMGSRGMMGGAPGLSGMWMWMGTVGPRNVLEMGDPPNPRISSKAKTPRC
jgi:hypothetical protein